LGRPGINQPLIFELRLAQDPKNQLWLAESMLENEVTKEALRKKW